MPRKPTETSSVRVCGGRARLDERVDRGLVVRAVARVADHGLAVVVGADQVGELVVGGDGDAVEAGDQVAGLEPGKRRGAGWVARLAGRALLGVGDDAVADLADHRRAGVDLAVRGVAVEREDAPEEEERDRDVHRRAAGHHDDLLPPRHLVEEPRLVLGPDQLPLGRPGVGDELGEHPGVGLADLGDLVALLVVGHRAELLGPGRQHPDDLHVAAERDRLHAVLGLAAPAAPDGRAEADEVLGHLPAEGLGRDHVAELVEPDRHQDRAEEDHYAERVIEVAHPLVPPCPSTVPP